MVVLTVPLKKGCSSWEEKMWKSFTQLAIEEADVGVLGTKQSFGRHLHLKGGATGQIQLMQAGVVLVACLSRAPEPVHEPLRQRTGSGPTCLPWRMWALILPCATHNLPASHGFESWKLAGARPEAKWSTMYGEVF